MVSTDSGYAIVWKDGFPSTLHATIEEARAFPKEAEEKSGISGKILTVKEYLNSGL